MEVLPLESPVDREYATLRHYLTRQGTPIGPNDPLIAAHALAEGLTVVTVNAGEFSRVPALAVGDVPVDLLPDAIAVVQGQIEKRQGGVFDAVPVKFVFHGGVVCVHRHQ